MSEEATWLREELVGLRKVLAALTWQNGGTLYVGERALLAIGNRGTLISRHDAANRRYILSLDTPPPDPDTAGVTATQDNDVE